MWLDIIVPAFNAEKTIQRTLNSISNQIDALEGVKLTIINDGSTDQTLFKIVQWIKDLPSTSKLEVDYITRGNRGIGATRQEAIESTTGEYLLFIDADDVISPLTITYIKNGLLKTPDFMSFDFQRVDVDGKPYVIPNANTTWFHGKVYSRKFLNGYRIKVPELRINEDSGFNMAVAAISARAYRSKEVWYFWVSNPDSITGRLNEREIFLEFLQSMRMGFEMGIIFKPPQSLFNIEANIVGLYQGHMEFFHKKKLDREQEVLEEMKKIAKMLGIQVIVQKESFQNSFPQLYEQYGPKFPDCKMNFEEWLKYIES